jgi:hypothetical protein
VKDQNEPQAMRRYLLKRTVQMVQFQSGIGIGNLANKLTGSHNPSDLGDAVAGGLL